MYKTRLLILAAMFPLSACSTAEALFGPSEESVAVMERQQDQVAEPAPAVAAGPTAAEVQARTLNDNIQLIKDKMALKAELEDARVRISTLESEAAASHPVPESVTLAESADVRVYERNVSQETHQAIVEALRAKSFSPIYPSMPKSMGMAIATTVFYYDNSYISTAGELAQTLAKVLNAPITIKKGASAFNKNRLVVQIRG